MMTSTSWACQPRRGAAGDRLQPDHAVAAQVTPASSESGAALRGPGQAHRPPMVLLGVTNYDQSRRYRTRRSAPRRQLLPFQGLAVPEGVSSGWEVLDSTHQFVPVALVELASLKVIGEVNGLRATSRRRLGLSGGDKPRLAQGRDLGESDAPRGSAARSNHPRSIRQCQPRSRRRRGQGSPTQLPRQAPSRLTPHDGSPSQGIRCHPAPDRPRSGTPRQPTRQASTICSITERSSN